MPDTGVITIPLEDFGKTQKSWNEIAGSDGKGDHCERTREFGRTETAAIDG